MSCSEAASKRARAEAEAEAEAETEKGGQLVRAFESARGAAGKRAAAMPCVRAACAAVDRIFAEAQHVRARAQLRQRDGAAD